MSAAEIHDSDSSSYSSSEEARPNRWKGNSSTWARLTQEDRDLAATLDALRNQDLSVHLYNAHALKRSAREYNKQRTKADGDGHGGLKIPEGDRTYCPPKRWTAWPLPPEQVPRVGETIGPDDPAESYTYKRVERNGEGSSRELEEVLTGVVVRFAKERWLRRREAQEEEDMDIDGGDLDSDESHDGAIKAGTGEIAEGLRDFGASSEKILDPGGEGDSEALASNSVLKPVVSADDERSRELLRPSIRHTLSKLDEVLMALHHARKTCHRYSNSDGNTDDEAQAEAESVAEDEDNLTPAKRPKGRPRKFANGDRSRARGLPPNDDELLRPKTTNRGRPKKVYPRLEGETEQEYLVRVARLRKKPLPSFAPPLDPSPSPSPPARKRKSPIKRSTSEEIQVSRQKKLGLRDWSEVIGSAALVGISPDVIARATQRCANLFGEGMVLRSMVEMPFSEKDDADFETRYEPELIPSLSSEEAVESSSGSSESEVDVKNQSLKRPMSKSQNVFCPIAECPRKIRGFRDVSGLKRHLVRGHLIDEGELGEYLLGSDEECEGAVHVDGFLRGMKGMRRVKQRRAEKGKGKGKEKVANESSESSSSSSEGE
jgi:hypothetical protein